MGLFFMARTIDQKPSIKFALGNSPENRLAKDIKPVNKIVRKPDTVFMETRSVPAGGIMLLVPFITYPVAGTFTATRI